MKRAPFNTPDLDRLVKEQEEIPGEIAAKCERNYAAAAACLEKPFARPKELRRAVGKFHQVVWMGKPYDLEPEILITSFEGDADFVFKLAGGRWQSWWDLHRDLKRGCIAPRALINELFAICVRWNTESYASVRVGGFLEALDATSLEERNAVSNAYWSRFGKYYDEDCLFHLQAIREFDYKTMFRRHPDLVMHLQGRARQILDQVPLTSRHAAPEGA